MPSTRSECSLAVRGLSVVMTGVGCATAFGVTSRNACMEKEVSNYVGSAWDVSNAYIIVAPGHHGEEVAYQGHEMCALTRALLPDYNYCCIVAVKQDVFSLPGEAPGSACCENGLYVAHSRLWYGGLGRVSNGH